MDNGATDTSKCYRATIVSQRNYLLQQIALGNARLRRYQQAEEMYSRALEVRPEDARTVAARAALEIDWKADPRPLHQAIDSMRAKIPVVLLDVADQWLLGSLIERDAPAAERALSALGEALFGPDAFTAARLAQEAQVQAQPDYGPPLAVLGLSTPPWAAGKMPCVRPAVRTN